MNVFKLEEYLGKYEFSAPYLLCCSDAESWNLNELLTLADDNEQTLWNQLSLGYTEVKGSPVLRRTIIDQHYSGFNEDQVLCFAGAEEGIFCALYALLEPEDHVIVLTPCYQSLLELPKVRGCSVTPVSLKETKGWQIDLEEIKKAITPNTKWLVMNFPHNPTGQIITQEELKALVRLLDHHGIWLFSDEVYRLLGSAQWSDPAALAYHRALSLGVMSKAYGLAGLRVGWLACQDRDVLKKIEKTKHYTSICNSAPSEILSLIALRCQNILLERNNTIVKQNLTLLDQFFNTYKDLFSWVRPQGGCVGFVRYHGPGSVDEFCQSLLAKTGVLLLPGSVYDVGSPHFRIGFGRKNMAEALINLERYICD